MAPRPLLLLALLASPTLFPPQEPESKEPPRITLEKTATLNDWVETLQSKFAIRYDLDEDAENKEIKVSLRDAGYFESLDALCRTHGKITYFFEGSDNSTGSHGPPYLTARDWKEYPVQYSGHFKTILTSFLKTRRTSSLGAATWIETELCVMGPPWHNLEFSAGTEFKWEILEAQDSHGKDVRYKDDESRNSMLEPRFTVGISGNVESRTFHFEDFDLDKGLKLLSGKVAITVADSKIVRIPLDASKSVAIPGGTLKFESMQEADKDESGAEWRIAFLFTPQEGGPRLESVLESTVRYEGRNRWHYEDLRWAKTFEIETMRIPKAPTWVEFRVRMGERTIDVPFRFKDVVLKGK